MTEVVLRDPLWITADDLVREHRVLMLSHGGNPDQFPCDRGKLDAAANGPLQWAYGKELYPSLYDKVAALILRINQHACADGNKRLSLVAAHICLAKSGRKMRNTPELTSFFCELRAVMKARRVKPRFPSGSKRTANP